ncbi:hypothetical protein [Paraburkholderia sp. 2C]|jgi:hypothetical protein
MSRKNRIKKMKEARKISAAEIVWLVCFLLLCFYPPTFFGKVMGFIVFAILIWWYVRGDPRLR